MTAEEMKGWIKIRFLTPAHEILHEHDVLGEVPAATQEEPNPAAPVIARKGEHTGAYAERKVLGYGWQEIQAGSCIAVYDDKGKKLTDAEIPAESSVVTGELVAKKPF